MKERKGSCMKVYGITFPDEDQVLTIHDMKTEMRKEVNDHDRSYGLDLKHPKKIDFRILYEYRKNQLITCLTKSIEDMNRVDFHNNESTFFSDFIMGRKDGLSKFLFHHSELWRGEMRVLDQRSDVFRKRFLTLLYSEIIKYVDEIVDMEFKSVGRKLLENEDRCMILENFIKTINNFHVKLLSGEDTLEAFLKLEYYLSNRKKRKTKEKVCNILNDRMKILSLNKGMLGYYLEDDEVINEIIKMAYVAVTENPDISGTSKLVIGVTFEDPKKIRSMVINLGKDILEYRDMYPEKPLMYDAYLYANPQMLTMYPDVNHNNMLLVGVRAMFYLGFLSGNKEIQKIITKIV